jgi:outer membrane protein assembly factor BamA
VIFLPFRRQSAKSYSHQNKNIFIVILSAIALLAMPNAHSQQASSTQAMQLSKIEVIGLHRYTHEQVVSASGLQIGQNINPDMLDAAANRLVSSGLFKKLSYRLRGGGGKAIVTFEVEELMGGVPVVFDNFVWFSDEELVGAIRRELPSFDGTAPETGGMTDSIAKALQQLLQERKISGRVEYTPSADVAGRNPKHIFSVKGMSIPICALQFPGAADVQDSELVKSSKPLFGGDYSKEFVASFAEENLKPIYRQRGHLRAAFQAPAAKPENNSNCKDGVSVSVPVEEGLIYSWDKAQWSGNTVLRAEELESALGMKAGELANGLKIDTGFKSVREAYGKKGFIMSRATSTPSFDDATRRVAYSISLDEGPQFHMGNLIITGLSEGDAKSLKERWKLRPGDIYNDAYLDEFMKNTMRGFMMRMGPGAGRINTEIKPDRQNLTVDVILNLKK